MQKRQITEQPKKNRKKRRNRNLRWIIGILLALVLAAGFYIYSMIFRPFSLPETVYIYIDREQEYEQVMEQLKEKTELPSEKVFRLLADRMNLSNTVKTGRYAIEDGMTMPEVIRRLRSGQQAPVNLTFNNTRTLENLAGRVSRQLMMDSLSLLNSLHENARDETFGFDEERFPVLFIPNTYEVYWNTSIDDLLRRMKREYDAFWNESRKEKAKRIGLSPVEVSILASIVEEEVTYADEYHIVARFY